MQFREEHLNVEKFSFTKDRAELSANEHLAAKRLVYVGKSKVFRVVNGNMKESVSLGADAVLRAPSIHHSKSHANLLLLLVVT